MTDSDRSYKTVINYVQIDSWLDRLGFYRKNIPFDRTCLFRAIAEQLYCSQLQHERVRGECLEYGRKYPEEFGGELEDHMVFFGEILFKLISKTYKRDIILFDGINFEVKNVTENNYDEKFRICVVTKDHCDVIYSKEYIATAGFCQSIAYGILYENVLGVENVTETADAMLHGKTLSLPIESAVEKEDVDFSGKFLDELQNPVSSSFRPPFTYKVAKALHPDIYRNIAYDAWVEKRREKRLGKWHNGDNRLVLGMCCELKSESDATVRCYIQEFLKGREECLVYIPACMERKIVKYADLVPESDAMPWPLPPRFREHSPSPAPTLALSTKRRNHRKNKNKRVYSSTENAQETEREVGAFEGNLLQFHTPVEGQGMAVVPPRPSAETTPQDYSLTAMNNLSPLVYSNPTPSPYSYVLYPPSTSAVTPGEHQPPPMYYTDGYVEPGACALVMPTTPPPLMYLVYPMPGALNIHSIRPLQMGVYTAPPPPPPAPSNQMLHYAPNVPASPFVFPTTAPSYNAHNGY